MDRQTELELIEEILSLRKKNAFFLDKSVSRNHVVFYTDPDRFQREQTAVLKSHPRPLAHVSELAEAGAFLSRSLAGLPILLTRGKDGTAHAFLNVCRHRGTRLVNEKEGCRHRFSCPYHAWTYSSAGDLIAAPHFADGFEGIQKSELGLKRLNCEERFGFIWVTATDRDTLDLDTFFGDLGDELAVLNLENMVIAGQDETVRHANWKLLVEGGIEAYHFKAAHSRTIGPHFEDNLSTYRAFGPHLRSVLARTSLASLSQSPSESWRLRDHAQILYTLFPTTSLLVQQDHIAWIQQDPVGVDQTRLRLVTLAPKEASDQEAHWARNHAITKTTLEEDFDIGESIQASFAAAANETLLFGRFEGALDKFNQAVEGCLNRYYMKPGATK